MPSLAHNRWRTQRACALAEIDAVHRSFAGTGALRRAAMQQLNQAYVLLLASEFQGFCRDLHTECADALILGLPSADLQNVIYRSLMLGRRLDTGNPNPRNIGADFGRFNLPFWALIDADHPRNPRRKALLEEMNRWRNAIAHNDYAPDMTSGQRTLLARADVRRWHKACDGLARWFDRIMYNRLKVITGNDPW
jgi:hypothetical protein